MKIAAEWLHPGDHPLDANPHAVRPTARVSGGFLSTLPVIADDQIQFLAYPSETD
jgi:hypothetical protein